MKNLRIIVATLLVTATIAAHAQTIEPPTPGKQVARQTVIQGHNWQYWLYLPPGYDSTAATRWPMIVSFPPYNSTIQGGAFSDIVQNTIPYLLKTPATCKYVSDRFVVVAPYIATVGYPKYADSIHALIQNLTRTLKVDSNRVDLFGTCAGGNIGYLYATQYPDFYASMVLFAVNDGWSFQFDLTKACLLKNIPMKIYNADGDPYTPFARCQSVATTINGCSGGGKAEFVLVHDNIHEIWRYVDTTKALYDWMLLQHKGTTTVSTPEAQLFDGFSGKEYRAQRIAGRMNRGDQQVAMTINGRIVSGRQGNGPTLKQGIYVIRATRNGRSVSRITLIQ